MGKAHIIVYRGIYTYYTIGYIYRYTMGGIYGGLTFGRHSKYVISRVKMYTLFKLFYKYMNNKEYFFILPID